MDAFTFKWSGKFFYVFPPFRLAGKVARKIVMDKTKAVLVVPEWPTQPWFAAIQRWAKGRIKFPRKKGNLSHQGPLAEKGDVSTTPLAAFLF